MEAKTSQLQIRVSPSQKAALKRLARHRGCSVSELVLSAVLPSVNQEFQRLAQALEEPATRREALSALRAFLGGLGSSEELAAAVAGLDLRDLGPVARNLAAAAVEERFGGFTEDLPSWLRSVPALDRPYFGWRLRSLRPHLMRLTPVAYKRRNLYVDATHVESPRR